MREGIDYEEKNRGHEAIKGHFRDNLILRALLGTGRARTLQETEDWELCYGHRSEF